MKVVHHVVLKFFRKGYFDGLKSMPNWTFIPSGILAQPVSNSTSITATIDLATTGSLQIVGGVGEAVEMNERVSIRG